MRGSLLVLALSVAPFITSPSQAQTTAPKCATRPRSTSDGGASRADPADQGNKNCAPPVSLGHTAVSGTVFFDVDQNGVLGPDEVGLSGWQVQLTGPVTQTVVTDGNGAYSFTGLTAGNYMVCVLPPAGWTQLAPTSGAACASGFGFSISAPALVVDTGFTGIDFGFVSQ